jgi:hypothetical protein
VGLLSAAFTSSSIAEFPRLKKTADSYSLASAGASFYALAYAFIN